MQKEKKREGFSLVELVIVITIMAILTGLLALGLGYMNTADAKGVSGKINSGFTELKSENMAKNDKSYMHLYRQDGTLYLYFSKDASFTNTSSKVGKDIGGERVTVTLDGTTTGTTTIADGTVVTFSIRKKDGAFDDNGITALTDSPELKVSGGGSEYTIILVKATGRHYIE